LFVLSFEGLRSASNPDSLNRRHGYLVFFFQLVSSAKRKLVILRASDEDARRISTTETASVDGTSAKPNDTVEAMLLRAETALEDCLAQGGNRTTVRND
jgi:hypothetical protein